jgi:hypothetical protein
MTVALIAAGRFVTDSMAAEFGDIPPSFLPLGNKRLYVRQIELLRQYTDRIYISLPADYDAPDADIAALESLGATIIRSDRALSIGAAVSLCANIIGEYQGRLILLYGDTVIEESDLSNDGYSMHVAYDHQAWAPGPVGQAPQVVDGGRMMVSGLFSFSDIPLLLRSISLRRGDFIGALALYDAERGLTPATAGRWYDFGHV